jgi:amino acid permease
MWRAFSSLFIAAAGAGLLSYPYAVKQQGILLCTLLTCLFGALNVVTDFVLLQTAYLFRAPLRPAPGFDLLCLHALGPRHARVAAASIVLGALGAQIGYLIAIGDLLSLPLQAATGCPASAAPACALTSRALLIPAVAFSVTMPLTFLGSVESLGHSSALAAVTVLAVSGVVAAQGLGALAQGHPTVVGSTAAAASMDAPEDLVLSRWSWSLFLGIPISVFSLGNHMQVISLFFSARPALQARFPAVVMAAVASCVALYLFTGVLGYAAYGVRTQGDIMLNLPSNGVTAAGKVLLAIHLLLSYPVLFFPSRRSLMTAAGEAARALQGGGGRGGLARACSFLSTSSFAIPLLATAASALLAVAAPSISTVFGLLGATIATYQIYFVPGLLLLKFAAALEGKGRGVSASDSNSDSDSIWATVPNIWGAGGEAEALLQAPPEPAEEGQAGGGEEAEAPPPNLLPLHSPALTRALAWLLLALSAAIGVCGTLVYILTTFSSFG